MSLKEPIVEGAYTEERAKALGDVVDCLVFALNKGVPKDRLAKLTCSVLDVYLVPIDPAEVVAELRRMAADQNCLGENYEGEKYLRQAEDAIAEAADLVAEKLGVES